MVSAKKLAKRAASAQTSSPGSYPENSLSGETFEEFAGDSQDSAVLDEPVEVPVELPKQDPKPKTTPPKAAHAVQNYDEIVTRIATKSTVKFIGRWYTLRKGKPIIAPRVVIENLELAGLVEKK